MEPLHQEESSLNFQEKSIQLAKFVFLEYQGVYTGETIDQQITVYKSNVSIVTLMENNQWKSMQKMKLEMQKK